MLVVQRGQASDSPPDFRVCVCFQQSSVSGALWEMKGITPSRLQECEQDVRLENES